MTIRGLATILFGNCPIPEKNPKVLVVCSSDENLFPGILDSVQNYFTGAQFTYVAPAEYIHTIPDGSDVILLSDLKTSIFGTLLKVRARKYDVTVLMLTGRPVFRKTKLWALFTNYCSLMIWNENRDCFFCGSKSHRTLLGHLRWRFGERGIVSVGSLILKFLLFPLGIFYLIMFTFWVKFKSSIRAAAGN